MKKINLIIIAWANSYTVYISILVIHLYYYYRSNSPCGSSKVTPKGKKNIPPNQVCCAYAPCVWLRLHWPYICYIIRIMLPVALSWACMYIISDFLNDCYIWSINWDICEIAFDVVRYMSIVLYVMTSNNS